MGLQTRVIRVPKAKHRPTIKVPAKLVPLASTKIKTLLPVGVAKRVLLVNRRPLLPLRVLLVLLVKVKKKVNDVFLLSSFILSKQHHFLVEFFFLPYLFFSNNIVSLGSLFFLQSFQQFTVALNVEREKLRRRLPLCVLIVKLANINL